MANPEHLKILKQGVEVWNRWREEEHPWGLSLHKVDLKDANLSGANLRGVYFKDSEFSRVNFEGANLKGASLKSANLKSANLRGANLKGANLTRANLANLKSASLKGANLKGAKLQAANLSKVDFSGVILEGANLEDANIKDASLAGANLKGAILTGTDFRGCDLKGAVLQRADLRGANLSELDLKGTILLGADLRDAKLSKVDFSGAILQGANLSGAILQGANLRGANLQLANLTGLNLIGFDLKGTILQSADLGGANLSELDLRGTVLQGANLRGANLSGADLRHANLRKANLSRANLVGAHLSGAHLIGADLSAADLLQADLRGAFLQKANITKACLRDTAFTPEPKESRGVEDSHLEASILISASDSSRGGSFLELATCQGIEFAGFSSPNFLPDYLSKAFAYAHRQDTHEAERWPVFAAQALESIKALRPLFPDSEPPYEIIDLSREISTELVRYLAKHPKALYEIKPRQFEELIAEVLASFGWQIELTPATHDGGYDLFAISKDITGAKTSWIIECKKYRQDRKVGIDVVRGLYGVKIDLRVANMMLATTSYFSRDVRACKASRYDLELRDYEGVLEWLNEYRPHPNGQLYVKENKLVMPEEKT